MKRTSIMSGLLIILLFITGCSSQNKDKMEYKYTGENENWKVEYTTTSKNGDQYERNLKFTYKGDLSDLKSHKSLKYSYKTDINHGSGEIDLGDYINTTTFEHGVSGEGSNIVKEETIKVSMSLDQESETIDLK